MAQPSPDSEALLILDADAPPEYLCPITMSIMKDPVLLPDGQTYERSAIERALQSNPVSPLTRQPMDISQAKPNYALKSLIEKYIKERMPEVTNNQSTTDIQQLSAKIPVIQLDSIEIDSFTGSFSDNSLLVSIKSKTIEGRLPISIIAMVDISGSMAAEASDVVTTVENASFSRLQLIQFSLQTILSLLGEHDTLTLITFSNSAQMVLPITNLNEAGKQKANQIINNLYPTGATDIWSALDMAIDEAVSQYQKRKIEEKSLVNTSLLLFTDGEPNRNPPMGIIPSLKDKLEDCEMTFTISTFGFGYSIDSYLMEEIARTCNGVYGYCPDATMVGSIFINYLSSLASMVSPLASLNVELDGSVNSYHLSLYNGVSANVMVLIDENKAPTDYKISLNLPLTHQTIEIASIQPLAEDQKLEFKNQQYRKMLIDILSKIADHSMNHERGFNESKNLYELLVNEPNRTPYMKNLMIDLLNDDPKHGQICKALEKEYFQKWGKDYLFSLLRFHILEQSGNFKDMSLQLYGNDTFRSFRKVANKIFMNIPLPQSQKRRHIGRFHGATPPSDFDIDPRMSTLSTIHSRSIGCFNGDALVDLQNGQKKVLELKKGDILSNGQKVECLVKLATKDGHSDAVKIGEAYFSPYHPIKFQVADEKEKRWVFPINVGALENIKLDYWFNIVLEKSAHSHLNNPPSNECRSAVIGGIEAVTLGHGITEGVCSHPYFGTEKVIEALQKHRTYSKGFLQFDVLPTPKRDSETDMIVELF